MDVARSRVPKQIAGQLDTAPAAYIALAIVIITHSNHRAVRFKADGMSATRRNCYNIAPVTYIALTILIPAHSRHSTVRFKADGMTTTNRDRHNTTPAAHISLAYLILTY